MGEDECDKDGCEKRCKVDKNILCDQEEQFMPYTPDPVTAPVTETAQEKKEREWQEARKKRQEKQTEQLEEFYDAGPREDGTSHAGVMEHVSFLGCIFSWIL